MVPGFQLEEMTSWYSSSQEIWCPQAGKGVQEMREELIKNGDGIAISLDTQLSLYKDASTTTKTSDTFNHQYKFCQCGLYC